MYIYIYTIKHINIWYILKEYTLGLDQGCTNPVLEGWCPAEFSSNPN